MLNTISAILNNGVSAVGDYESLSTITLTASQTSIEFTSISSAYTHLQLRGTLKDDRPTYINDGVIINFNGDTGTNYTRHRLWGDGSTASAAANTSINGSILYAGTAAAGTNIFSGFVLDILDYTNTNKYKTIRALNGVDGNGSGYISLDSGLWQNTAAINSIKFTPQSGTNFLQYSKIALYGVK